MSAGLSRARETTYRRERLRKLIRLAEAKGLQGKYIRGTASTHSMAAIHEPGGTINNPTGKFLGSIQLRRINASNGEAAIYPVAQRVRDLAFTKQVFMRDDELIAFLQK